jgi:D-alanine-D-alanine ligase
MKKVLVLAGGFSAEREVSLVSGKGAFEALQKRGYRVIFHDLTSADRLIDVLRAEKPDVVFNALHGNWGEDGAIQGFLDLLRIPYTHSGMVASMIGMNKFLTKQIARENHIPVAEGENMTYAEFLEKGTKLPYPYVVKPQSDGSSVGVFIVRNDQDRQMVSYDDPNHQLLIEKYIEGRELTVSVVGDRACAVTELKPETEFYDYQAKYTAGLTHHVLPAQIPDEVAKAAMSYAEKIHKLLGCSYVSRSDLRYNPKDGVVLLEVNTNPGMTPLSLVPEQAKYVGISYEDLCAELVEKAQCRPLG